MTSAKKDSIPEMAYRVCVVCAAPTLNVCQNCECTFLCSHECQLANIFMNQHDEVCLTPAQRRAYLETHPVDFYPNILALITMFPEDGTLHEMIAQKLFIDRRFIEAASAIKRANQLKPTNIGILRAIPSYLVGDYGDQDQVFDKEGFFRAFEVAHTLLPENREIKAGLDEARHMLADFYLD